MNTRKTVDRMYTAKAQLGSVSTNLQVSMSMLKMQGVLGKSTEIMHSMNQLMNVKEMSVTMGDMAREMERAGLIDEIISETMESMEPEGLDSAGECVPYIPSIHTIHTYLTLYTLYAIQNTLYHTIPHYTTLYHTIPHYTTLYHTIHYTTLYPTS